LKKWKKRPRNLYEADRDTRNKRLGRRIIHGERE